MKKIVTLISIMFLIILVSYTTVLADPNSSKGFLTYTDEQAEKEREEIIKAQENNNTLTEVKSTNNYLKSLSVYGYEITPEFDKQTINYEITQEIVENYLEIKAETDDEKASVSGTGKITLNSGENNLKIDVTAESGTVRTYFIKIMKPVKNNIRLNSLELKTDDDYNIEITPEFDKDTFEYNCEVASYIEKIDVEAIANDENANIEITGNENLQQGLNEILIAISLDDDETITYKINVYKEQTDEIQKGGIDYKTIVIIMIAIAIIGLIIFWMKSRKNHK